MYCTACAATLFFRRCFDACARIRERLQDVSAIRLAEKLISLRRNKDLVPRFVHRRRWLLTGTETYPKPTRIHLVNSFITNEFCESIVGLSNESTSRDSKNSSTVPGRMVGIQVKIISPRYDARQRKLFARELIQSVALAAGKEGLANNQKEGGRSYGADA